MSDYILSELMADADGSEVLADYCIEHNILLPTDCTYGYWNTFYRPANARSGRIKRLIGYSGTERTYTSCRLRLTARQRTARSSSGSLRAELGILGVFYSEKYYFYQYLDVAGHE